MQVLDVERVFTLAGGNRALRKLLTQDVGFAPTEAACGMWRTRERISSEWMAQVVASLLERNPTLSYRDLLTIEDPFAP